MKAPKAAFRKKLAIALLCSALIMALYTGLVSYHLAKKEFRQLSSQMMEQNIMKMSELLSDYGDNVQTHTTQILSSTSLRSLAGKKAPSLFEVKGYDSSISVFIRVAVANIARMGVNFKSVDVYLTNGYIYSTSDAPLYMNYLECLDVLADQGMKIREPYIRTQWGVLYPRGETNPSPSCIRFIYDASAKKVGVAVFMLENKDFTKVYSSIDSAYMVNSRGTIISSAGEPKMGTMTDKATFLESMRRDPSGSVIAYTDMGQEVLAAYWPAIEREVFLIVPFKAYGTILQTELSGYVRSVFLMTLIGVLFSLLIAAFLSDGLSKSIMSLKSFIKKVGRDDYSSHRYNSESQDEIAAIGTMVNEMIDRLQEAARIRERDIKSNQMLELSLLRSQINPHLLYNTLNSVLWNLEKQDVADAIGLIASLSEYFKLSLSSGKEIIELSQELSLVRHYIQIQQLARHKNTRMVLDVPQELYDHPLLKLTLQPIVENAILHGFDGYRDDGLITIAATHDEGLLSLVVRDNGIGILPDELEKLNSLIQEYPLAPNLSSFGLYNINRTIKRAYGEDYGLRIDSEISEFTCVTVIVPYVPPSARKEESHV